MIKKILIVGVLMALTNACKPSGSKNQEQELPRNQDQEPGADDAADDAVDNAADNAADDAYWEAMATRARILYQEQERQRNWEATRARILDQEQEQQRIGTSAFLLQQRQKQQRQKQQHDAYWRFKQWQKLQLVQRQRLSKRPRFRLLFG